MIRGILILISAVFLAVQVVRNAVVAGLATNRPADAAQVWPDHPAVELSLAMTRIAQASRAYRPVPPYALALIHDVAVKEPLAPEPLLARGAEAQLAGDDATAERAFEAAQWRDPRSLPAAYLLADHYFRAGDVQREFREVAVLARLSPHASAAVAPYLTIYAKDPRNWPALRWLFRGNPDLARPVMNALASDAATVRAVLALADPRQKAEDAPWLQPLLTTLTNAGDYAQAYAIWQRMTGARPSGLIYDSSFTDKVSPPPFNWSLTSSTVGLAEREPGARLHVLFYGQEDGFIATQMLLLAPGHYGLTMQLLGDRARARSLNWSVWCDRSEAPIASVSFDVAATKGWSFTVPSGCPAQWLKLSGISGDVSQQLDATIASLKLEKIDAGA